MTNELNNRLLNLADELETEPFPTDLDLLVARLRELADPDGVLRAAWQKKADDQALSSLLALVGVTVPWYSVGSWTPEARDQVERWAGLTHLSASDNDVEVPPRPPFLHDHASVDYHNCYFCGTFVYNGYEGNGTRHWLSDCRPDLVEHEIGMACTWWGVDGGVVGDHANCYAYQDRSGPMPWPWTDEHEHFDTDGPM